MSQFSRMAHNAMGFGRDGLHLVQRFVKNGINSQGRQPARSLLLHAAREEQNRVATSILLVDQQIGLMRYFGLSKYLSQHLAPRLGMLGGQGTNTVDSLAGFATNTGNGSDEKFDSDKARVAFMITASMKSELADRLGYSAEGIKKLTPMEASLILNNDVKPEDKESSLPGLVEEYEKEQEARREIERLKRLREEQQLAEEQAKLKATDVISQKGDSEDQIQLDSSAAEGQSVSPNALHGNVDGLKQAESQPAEQESMKGLDTEPSDTLSPTSIVGFADKSWYEIVEMQEDGSDPRRLGLYSNTDEGNLAMDTRKSIAKSKGLVRKFELRKVANDSNDGGL